MDKVVECVFKDMHHQVWYFATDRVFASLRYKKSASKLSSTPCSWLETYVSHKIQDLDVSESGENGGQERKLSGDDGSRAFNSNWNRNDRKVYFGSYSSGNVNRICARPSFV